jgi:hypothetical protein
LKLFLGAVFFHCANCHDAGLLHQAGALGLVGALLWIEIRGKKRWKLLIFQKKIPGYPGSKYISVV